MPGVVRRVRPARQAPALRRAVARASSPARRSTRWVAGRPRWSTSRRSSAASSTSAPSCSRWPPCCSRAEMIRKEDPERGKAAYELAEAFCVQSRLRIEEAVRPAVDQLRRRRPRSDRPRPRRATTPGSRTGVIDPSEGTGPWIATWEPGESKVDERPPRLSLGGFGPSPDGLGPWVDAHPADDADAGGPRGPRAGRARADGGGHQRRVPSSCAPSRAPACTCAR